MAKNKQIRVGISVGDINGIGGEIILKALKDKAMLQMVTPIIFASNKFMSYQKKLIKEEVSIQGISDASQAVDGRLNVVNIWNDSLDFNMGEATEEGGKRAYESLEAATQAVIDGTADVLVTAPINKKNIQSENFKFPGHTEYLGEKWGGKPMMLMVFENLRVAMLSGHVPLSEVKNKLNKDDLVNKIKDLEKILTQDFFIHRPKIAVLGLNPHAGDAGLLGSEEQEIITPAIEEAKNQGVLAFGPFSADSFFNSKNLGFFDAVLAMYHDQGLIPFKTICFGQGVNYTANLKYIRTSPDHGVGYDIAGKNQADESSFRNAIFEAVNIYKKRAESIELEANKMVVHQKKKAYKEDEDVTADDIKE